MSKYKINNLLNKNIILERNITDTVNNIARLNTILTKNIIQIKQYSKDIQTSRDKYEINLLKKKRAALRHKNIDARVSIARQKKLTKNYFKSINDNNIKIDQLKKKLDIKRKKYEAVQAKLAEAEEAEKELEELERIVEKEEMEKEKKEEIPLQYIPYLPVEPEEGEPPVDIPKSSIDPYKPIYQQPAKQIIETSEQTFKSQPGRYKKQTIFVIIIGVIIAAAIAAISFIAAAVLIPLGIFAGWMYFGRVEESIDKIYSTLQYEKYLQKYKLSLIKKPKYADKKKSKKCDVWYALSDKIITKGMELYDVGTIEDLRRKSVMIKSITSTCSKIPPNIEEIRQKMMGAKVRGQKRTLWQWIRGK